MTVVRQPAAPTRARDLRRAAIVALNVALFWVALPALVLWLGRATDAALALAPPPTWARAAFGALALAGATLCGWSVLVLIRRGRGLPISALPPTRFVATGPYRWWRHPIYAGYGAALAGFGGAAGSPATALVVIPALGLLWVNTWVRRYEEPGLVRRFGATWLAHRRRTGLLLPWPAWRPARAALLWLFQRLVRVRFEGLEHVPARGPVLFLSDHPSYADFFLAQAASPRPTLIPVTAEAFRSPLKRWIVSIVGGVPHRRYHRDGSTGALLEAWLAAGGDAGIALPGERSWTGVQQPVSEGVARWIARQDVPIVPVALVGSYRLWPRWAPRPRRGAPLTVRVGAPARLRDVLDDPTDPAAVARYLLDRIAALRDPREPLVDPGDYPGARPELALYRCPICGADDALAMTSRDVLACGACPARWRAADGLLTLTAPPSQVGRAHALAGWTRRMRPLRPLTAQSPPVQAADVELRAAPLDAPVTRPLRSRGRGRLALTPDALVWRGADRVVALPLAALHTVNTERADTLQVATADQVVQLVLSTGSPLRWQRLVETQQEALRDPA